MSDRLERLSRQGEGTRQGRTTMSQETSWWLNNMTLQGFTDKRGTAWHYMESEQGAEPNHYPGAIPVPDVKRRLFDWEPVTGEVQHKVKLHGRRQTVADDELKSYFHPETGDKLGVV